MNTSVRFGLRIPPCRDAVEVAETVVRAEQAGFDIAWLPDSQFLWRDVWSCLALAAVRTSRITLAPCVTNVVTRHVSVTAAAAATLEEIAPGRTVLGLGTGDSAVKTLGVAPSRLADMAEALDHLRALLAGGETTFGDRAMRLHRPLSTPVPLYLAANGPRSLALAGRCADGVINLGGFTEELFDATRRRIGVGAASVGRAMSEIDVAFGSICHVTDDAAEAARIVRPYVVASAQTGGAETLRSIGIDIDPPPVVDGIYPDMSHAEDWTAAAEAAEAWVDDAQATAYADAYCVVGPAETCVARMTRLVAAGVRNFYVRHPSSYSMPDNLIEVFGEHVIPALRAVAAR